MLFKKRTIKPVVDIIILSHNNLAISQKFLSLLYKHSDVDFGVIWIENGSKDKTPEFLKDISSSLNNFTLMLNEDNKGVIGGRNQGYDIYCNFEYKPEYIIIIDNDQMVDKDWLSDHISFLDYGYDFAGVEGRQMKDNFMPKDANTSVHQYFNYVGCGGMIIRKNVLDTIGLFDPIFNPSYFEDPDFCFRAHDAGFKIGWNYRAKINHIPHQTLGFAKDKVQRFTKSLIAFRKKWNGRVPPKFFQKIFE